MALSVLSDRFSPVKFFITSRPVTKVMDGFRWTGLMKDTSALVLHSIPLDISQKDIRVYLEDRLSRIAQSFTLSSWPSKEEVFQLVKQSARLFIFAATVANFIQDPNTSNPKRQLRIMLTTTYIASNEISPHRHLDLLYLAVLRDAFLKINYEQQSSLRMILGTIVLLFDLLDPECLDALLGLEESTCRSMLRQLHSIAIVAAAGDGPVRPIHPSFHDFLVNVTRCDDDNFAVDSAVHHTVLAEYCLRTMQRLLQDMCELGDPSVYNQEVVDLPVRIANHILADVQYACRHWASHLSSGNIRNATLDLMEDFCSSQLLNWLEVMSLLGELDGVVAALQSTRRVVRVGYLSFSAIIG
jgi:hypothetical protein